MEVVRRRPVLDSSESSQNMLSLWYKQSDYIFPCQCKRERAKLNTQCRLLDILVFFLIYLFLRCLLHPRISSSPYSSDFGLQVHIVRRVDTVFRRLDRRKLVGSTPASLFSTSCERRLLIDISFHRFSYRNPTSIHQELNPSESSLPTTSFISTSKLLRPSNANNCIV